MSEVKNIPEGWVETTLGEVCTPKGGKRLPKGMSLVNYKTDHPYIRITDFNGNQINKNQLQFVTDDIFEHISRYIVNENDVIISIVGTVGLVAKIDSELDNASLTENCTKLIDLKSIDCDFLYYFLISKNGQDEINKNTVGAVQKKLPIYGVQNIKIELPKDIEEQKSIAQILTSFDNKIELLQAQNKTLEGTAQTIFTEWFGKYSVDDELPVGWSVGKIEDLTTKMNSGGTPSTKESTYYEGILNWFSTKELQDNFIFNSEKKITEVGLNNSSAKLFPTNTVIMAIYAAPTVGRLGILNQESAFNQAAIGLVAKHEIGYPFIFLLLKNLRDEFNNLANGAAQQNLNVALVKNYKTFIPDNKTLKSFNDFQIPIFEKIRSNSMQIQTLTKTRDELLQRLMSGEVRVKM